MKTRILVEALDLAEAQVDRENRTVRQRLIAAGTSKNRRRYSEALLQSAAPLFEGVKAYANHPTRSERREQPERSIRDITGWFEGVEYREGGLWATRHFTRNQAGNDAWAIVESIVEGHAPASLMGASINAVGRGSAVQESDGEVFVVEAIEGVHSVDDVTTPAAGGGWMSESAPGAGDLTDALLEALTFEEWYGARPEFTERVKREMKTARQDARLTEAQALAESRLAELQEAQTRIDALEAEIVAARTEAERVRREAAITEALMSVRIPREWREDLRARLIEAEPEQWAGLIEREEHKARLAGHRVSVHGAGPQVAPAAAQIIRESPLPLPDEDVQAWRRRISKGS